MYEASIEVIVERMSFIQINMILVPYCQNNSVCQCKHAVISLSGNFQQGSRGHFKEWRLCTPLAKANQVTECYYIRALAVCQKCGTKKLMCAR